MAFGYVFDHFYSSFSPFLNLKYLLLKLLFFLKTMKLSFFLLLSFDLLLLLVF
jgi:hypothetical protein